MFHVEHSHRDGRWIFSDMLMFHVEHWQSELEVGERDALES
jgi:hypothetical protein